MHNLTENVMDIVYTHRELPVCACLVFMYVGVESLHCAAIRSITANWEMFCRKVNHLPQSLQEDIVQYQKSKERRKDLKKLCTIE